MIKLADKTIDQKDYKVLIKFLQNGSYLNQSKETKKFENKFSKKLKTKNSIFVNSGFGKFTNGSNFNRGKFYKKIK